MKTLNKIRTQGPWLVGYIYIFKFYFGKTSSDRSQMSRFLKQYIQLSRYLHKDIGKGNRRMGKVEEKD